MPGKTTMIAAVAIAAAALATPGSAQTPLKMTLFGQPSVNNDSIWLALERGLYKAEGLDVTYRLFPSGTTAFQSFQTGQGDIVMTGDLPSVQYFFRSNGNYRTIAAIERDAKGYVVIAAKEIAQAAGFDRQDDRHARRVDRLVVHLGVPQEERGGRQQGHVKNLDTQVLPAALCGGEIAAFFIWQPIGSRTLEICPDKAHQLSDATGYVQGYLVAGARPEWLASAEGKDIATRWLRATIKGRDLAEKDFPAVAAYAKAKLDLSEKATRDQWDTNTRPLALDKVYYDDFCSLSRWAREEKLTDQPVDFAKLTWPDGLRAISAKLVDPPPPPC